MIRLFWFIFATLALPIVLIQAVCSPRLRDSFDERLGGGGWALWRHSGIKNYFWFHAASMGEVVGITSLVERVRQSFPDISILVTTTSVTGKHEAARRGLSDHVYLLPLDHPAFISRALGAVQAKLFIVTETELWPNLLLFLNERHVPCMLVNGRISDFSLKTYQRFRSLFEPVLLAFSRLLVQTKVDAERFSSLGVPHERLQIIGSMKYDHSDNLLSGEAVSELAESLGIDRSKPCFVAGSVRHGEEEMVVNAFCKARREIPALQFVIAPRHPERFLAVQQLLRARGLNFVRRSAGTKADGAAVLLDTMGELAGVYALGTECFVGGSLIDKLGGHNPLEPAAYRKPVIVGPHATNFRDAVAALKAQGGIWEVADEHELAQTICKLNKDEAQRAQSGEAAFAVWQSNQGTTERVFDEVRVLANIGVSLNAEDSQRSQRFAE